MRESTEIKLCQRLKAHRERQGMSLRALAAKSGLSINAVSRIERGDSSPTVASLARMAEALGIPIGAFFEAPPAPAAAVLRRDRRPRTEAEGVLLENLAPGAPDQRFEPFMLTLEPRASTPSEPITHSGQEFLLCLQGSVQVRVGEQTHPLATGDSLTFQASQPHACRNDSQGFATLLLVHDRDPQAAGARSPHLES